MITGSGVTLTGGPDDVWIFQIAADLQVGNGIHVTLAGGARAKNIFWQVGTIAVLGTTANFKGTIMAGQSITMNTSSTMEGRALAFTAGVTFNGTSGTLPDSGLPFVRITNQPPHLVTNAVTTVYLAGTNNQHVVGGMSWSNHTTAAAGPLTRNGLSNTWAATVGGLTVGANHIHVLGTNGSGAEGFDDATVVRLDAGANPPYIDITNGPHIFITYNVTNATFGGTNANVVGGMRWSNVTTRAGGALAATAAWVLTISALTAGVNEVYVYGTNGNGAFASEFIDVERERGPAGTGSPFVDITNGAFWADIYVPCVVAGTNNLDVVGGMWVSNAANGIVASFPAAHSWTSAPFGLALLTNVIRVFGTNVFGAVTNDTVLVIGVPEGMSIGGLALLTILTARKRRAL